jgi:hypothetical protein
MATTAPDTSTSSPPVATSARPLLGSARNCELFLEVLEQVRRRHHLTFSVVMTPAVIRRIVMENPSCIMLKHEDWHGLDKISTLRSYEREGSMRHISIFCGNDGLFLAFEAERGGRRRNDGLLLPGHVGRPDQACHRWTARRCS